MAKNKLRCTVTGLWYGVSAARRAKLVTKFKGEEALIEGFVSRDAIRLQKEGKSVEEIRAMAEAGTIKSNTNAPKRASTRSASKVAKAETDATADASDEDLDPDVKNFLGEDEDSAPTADASSKAR